MKNTNLLMMFMLCVTCMTNFGCKKNSANDDYGDPGVETPTIVSTKEAFYDSSLYIEATFEDESKMYFRLIDDATAEVVNSEAFSNEPYMYRGEITVPSHFIHMNHSYTVIGIGHGAFGAREYWNYYLREIHLPNTIEYLNGFYNCENLMEIHIPQSVKEIHSVAFFSSGLTGELIIPNSVITVGNSAFTGTNITSVTLGNSLNTIGKDAFRGCDFTEVVIPNSVTTIEDGAFGGYDDFYGNLGFKIKSLTIGSSVTNIGKTAFSCNDSIIVTCLAEFPPSLNQYAFMNENWDIIQNGTLCVPSQSIQYYMNSEWRYYFRHFTAIQ